MRRRRPIASSHVVADLDGRIDMVVDAGPTLVGVESTVLDLSQDPPVVLRPGALGIELLRTVIPNVRFREPVSDGDVLPSPGLMSRHYSPRTPVTLYEVDRDVALRLMRRDAGIVFYGGSLPAEFFTYGTPHVEQADVAEPAEVAARLYAALRECDDGGADAVFGLLIALWLLWGAWTSSSHALDQLMDREWPDELRERFLAATG